MSSSKVQAESPVFIPKGNKLAFAFEPATPSPSAATSTMSAKDIDIRECSLIDRQMLATGQRIFICMGERPIAEIPRPLFTATSTNADLLAGGLVKLPMDVDAHGVSLLVDYLIEMIFEPKETIEHLRMSNKMSIYDMLSVTAAANVLGMRKYTDHIYRKCEAYLRRHLPTYEELDAVTFFANKHPRLLRLLASENLAPRVCGNTIPDIADFVYYLSHNHTLKNEIQYAIAKHEEYLANRVRLEKERKDKDEALKRNERTKIQEERAKVQARKLEEERAVMDKMFWDQKRAEAAEDEKSVQAKLKLSVDKRKFTAREKAHWRRTRGTKLPKGC
jgi:hypothetical protein